METTGRTMQEATAGETRAAEQGEAEGAAAERQPPAAAGRPVRVSYVARGFGVALVVDEGPESDDGTGEATDAGLLRVSDAVVTLEIPRPDGGRSVLSWDPAEVAVDPLVA